MRENIVAIPCKLYGSKNECLGMTMKDIDCNLHALENFTSCTNLGLLATFYDKIEAAKEKNKKELKLFKETNWVERATKKQVLNAFE